ncbi:hypothetical protein FNV43_RR11184 [Rhamnella rubrinervis]|uniref:Uncharacterized protein n=1 Tax=Rhamnella rubrinervis TaxID=2594499 RepID=A0A8K0H5C4_9ROSA|nr:hypothetical protein FNV43_RR11184 [Rhamnella rubrinervis]
MITSSNGISMQLFRQWLRVENGELLRFLDTPEDVGRRTPETLVEIQKQSIYSLPMRTSFSTWEIKIKTGEGVKGQSELGRRSLKWLEIRPGFITSADGEKEGPSNLSPATSKKRLGFLSEEESSKAAHCKRTIIKVQEVEELLILFGDNVEVFGEERNPSFTTGRNSPSPIRTQSWRRKAIADRKKSHERQKGRSSEQNSYTRRN